MAAFIQGAAPARYVVVALVAVPLAVAICLKWGMAEEPQAAEPDLLSLVETVYNKDGSAALARRLGAHLDKFPRDARGWAILARLEFEMEHFPEAAQAYGKALALPSKVAKDPGVWCEYADALAMAQGGKLAGRPHELIGRALALNPDHPKALEMAGSAEYERGDYASALRYWRPLLAVLNPGSQPHTELAAAVARTERRDRMTIPPQRP